MALRIFRVSSNLRFLCGASIRSMSQTGELGEGAGKGGGGGGAVREAGGAFGKREAAFEEQYFRKVQAEQLKKLQDSLQEDITFHKEQIEEHETAKQLDMLHNKHGEEILAHLADIKQHQEAIDRHKSKIKKLKDMES